MFERQHSMLLLLAANIIHYFQVFDQLLTFVNFSLDLNAAESGVQHKPANRPGQTLSNDQPPKEGNCGC